jgi:hypothetical protein
LKEYFQNSCFCEDPVEHCKFHTSSPLSLPEITPQLSIKNIHGFVKVQDKTYAKIPVTVQSVESKSYNHMGSVEQYKTPRKVVFTQSPKDLSPVTPDKRQTYALVPLSLIAKWQTSEFIGQSFGTVASGKENVPKLLPIPKIKQSPVISSNETMQMSEKCNDMIVIANKNNIVAASTMNCKTLKRDKFELKRSQTLLAPKIAQKLGRKTKKKFICEKCQSVYTHVYHYANHVAKCGVELMITIKKEETSPTSHRNLPSN